MGLPLLGACASGKGLVLPAVLLYGENDSMTDLATIRTYTAQSGAELIIVPQGEHWFHTPEQLAVMADWERKHK